MSEDNRVIIRTDRAGVFFAEIKSRSGSEAVLTNSRRLWYWSGAASLSQLAMEGVSRPQDCKFPEAVKEQVVLGVIEILPTTEQARKCIDAIPAWRA